MTNLIIGRQTLGNLKACQIVSILIHCADFVIVVNDLDCCIYIMAIRVVEFSNGGYKIINIFAYESTYPKEIIEFWELV